MREVVSGMGAAIGENDAEAVKAQVGAIDAHGVFAFEETRTDAMRAATDAYVGHLAKGEKALLLAGSRLTCAQANDLVAARLRPAGSGVVLATSEGRRREYAVGDRIVLLKNDKRLGVSNGDTAQITEISRTQLTVAYDDGRVVTIDPRRYATFAHGWAVTIHKSQGRDERNVVLLGDAGMSAEMLHVGLTRATHHVRAYFSRETYADASAVAERVAQRMRTKRSAVDFERIVARTGGPETAWARRVRAAIADEADPYRRAHAADNRARKQTVDALIGGLVQRHRLALTQAPERRAALEQKLASETTALLEEHRPRNFVEWTIANRQRIEREAVARDATLAKRERARDAGRSPRDTVRARPERELVGLETLRILERDPYGLGSEALVVGRWDEAAGKAVVADHPPIEGDVELGEIHEVAAFSDGTYEVDDARTRQARETLARVTKPEQSVERGRGGRHR